MTLKVSEETGIQSLKRILSLRRNVEEERGVDAAAAADTYLDKIGITDI